MLTFKERVHGHVVLPSNADELQVDAGERLGVANVVLDVIARSLTSSLAVT